MRGLGWRTALAGMVLAGMVVAQAPRPMTFMDVMELRSVSGGQLSPDGARVVYTVSIPHWKSGKAYTSSWRTQPPASAAS